MEHMNFITDMVPRGLHHISTVQHMILPHKEIDVTFFGIFGAFSGVDHLM